MLCMMQHCIQILVVQEDTPCLNIVCLITCSPTLEKLLLGLVNFIQN